MICRKKLGCAIAVLLALSGWAAGALAQPAGANARGGVIAPLNSTPYGQTYGRWAAQWYQWALQIPADKNPLTDTDGRHCAERQVDEVWFLAGSNTGETRVRHCTIPANKALFFPLINNAFVAFLSDPPQERTEAFVREHAACSLPASIDVTIDGVAVPKPTKYFTGPSGSLSPLFNIQLPVANFFGFDEKTVPELALTPSAEQGYYLFVAPLPAGNHRIHWVATGCTNGGAQDITYILNVQ